jgi:hypothetical protein
MPSVSDTGIASAYAHPATVLGRCGLGEISLARQLTTNAQRLKTRKEIHCEACGSFQPMIEHEAQEDELNDYPWYDITCGTCCSIIASVRIVPESRALAPSEGVVRRPRLVK